MDWRLGFLIYCSQNAFWINLSWTSVFSIGSAVVLGLEYGRNKSLGTWLFVSLIRMVIRMLLGDNTEHACALNYARLEGCNGVRCLRRSARAMCDFYGFIWFLVGANLVYAKEEAFHKAPGVYIISFLNLSASVLYFLIPFLLQYSLMRRPPNDPADRVYLFHLQNELQSPLLSSPENLSQDQKTHWKLWLESHGCAEHEFSWEDICHQVKPHDHMQDIEANSTSSAVQEQLLQTDSRNSSEWSCSICLQSFRVAAGGKRTATDRSSSRDSTHDIEHGIVVSFPFTAKHLFHVSCLHSWLQVCRNRGQTESSVTCPCCRQLAS